MTKFEPRLDRTRLGEAEIAELGLDAGEVIFTHLVATGQTNGDSICLLVGSVEETGLKVWGRRGVGPDAQQFLPYIDLETGKTDTAVRYGCDSLVAYHIYGDRIPSGARRFTGAVFFLARVNTIERGWIVKRLVASGSGVQGVLDQATMYATVTVVAANWAIQQEALYGKVELT